MLPGMDGLEVCRRMRRSVTTPVVLLTALGAESDRITGLEIGADDYLTKPFSPRELTLRVQAVLRRARGSAGARQVGVQRDGDLTVDLGARQAVRDGTELVLTTREFDLLAFFLSNPGQVVLPQGAARPACGAGRSVTSPRSPCTSAGCGRSSRPTRPTRAACSRCGASGYRYQPQAST